MKDVIFFSNSDSLRSYVREHNTCVWNGCWGLGFLEYIDSHDLHVVFSVMLLMKIGIKQVVLVSFRYFEEVRLWPSACADPRIGRYFAIPLSIRSEST